MQINDLGVASTQSNPAPAVTNTPNGELGKDAFLKLLVAQMRFQDPLEPVSNTEFVTQLSQFTGVEQLVSINEGLNVLQIQQMGAANAQAASFVGKEIEVESSTLQVFNDTSSLSGSFALKGDAASIEVKIRDSSGAVVKTVELGNHASGAVDFTWDCKNENGNMVAPGVYRFDAVAKDENGNSVSWEPRVRGVVSGVSYSNGYPELLIGVIRASMSDIRGIYAQNMETF